MHNEKRYRNNFDKKLCKKLYFSQIKPEISSWKVYILLIFCWINFHRPNFQVIPKIFWLLLLYAAAVAAFADTWNFSS